MVSSETRNARAISAVSRPPRARSVSATCPSIGSAGWQQVKISSSRSSLITVSSYSSMMASGTGSRRIFSASVRSRRIRSIARLRAVVSSHAPGFAGTPDLGQRSAAIANASCAGILGHVEVPEEPDERGQHPAPLVPEDVIQHGQRGTAARHYRP